MNEEISTPDVAVVGGGPAGLAIATALRRLCGGRVSVLERESVAGGIPRHCGHPPFGMREFGRILTGPRYAQRLVECALANGVSVCTNTTVTSINSGPLLLVSTPDGVKEMRPRRVILATGVRETPRAARFTSGTRPMGIVTTGALQSSVYLGNGAPCTRPVIVGSELVSFSALLTCHHAGIRPVAMIDSRPRPIAWHSASLLPWLQRIPLLLSTRLERIEGRERVSGVVVRDSTGTPRRIHCDGVVFSGRFVAESTLARMAHLVLDEGTGGPLVDNRGCCSDPDFFAIGNLVHPANSAGSCWREGNSLARHVVASLESDHPASETGIGIRKFGPVIRYVSPQRIVRDAESSAVAPLWIRFAEAASGQVSLRSGDQVILRQTVDALPERQLRLRVPMKTLENPGASLDLHFETR